MSAIADLAGVLLPYVASASIAVLTSVGSFALYQAGRLIKSKTHSAALQALGQQLEIEASDRDTLHSAAQTAVNLILPKVAAAIDNAQIKNTAIAEAIDIVDKHAPEAIHRLGATPDHLGEIVESKLNTALQVHAK
jgi:hypothetical protein